MRILVADDERAIRKLIPIMLAILGHESMVAGNGLEAVELFLSGRHRIDLVITDLNMPVMDGCEVFRQIREASATTPVVLMSGNPAAEPPTGASFLEKPFTLATLRLSLDLAVAAANESNEVGRISGAPALAPLKLLPHVAQGAKSLPRRTR